MIKNFVKKKLIHTNIIDLFDKVAMITGLNLGIILRINKLLLNE